MARQSVFHGARMSSLGACEMVTESVNASLGFFSCLVCRESHVLRDAATFRGFDSDDPFQVPFLQKNSNDLISQKLMICRYGRSLESKSWFSVCVNKEAPSWSTFRF